MTYSLYQMNTAIKNLKTDVEYSYNTESGFGASTEEEFNLIEWVIGVDDGGSAITTTTNPHSEITWIAVKELMDSYD